MRAYISFDTTNLYSGMMKKKIIFIGRQSVYLEAHVYSSTLIIFVVINVDFIIIYLSVQENTLCFTVLNDTNWN